MLFSTLSTSILGFPFVVFAASHPHQKRQIIARAPTNFERGLTWTPRKRIDSGGGHANYNTFSNANLNNDFSSFSEETVIVITETPENSISQEELLEEQELSQLIQEQLFLLQAQNFVLDNIRKNHYRSRNNNVNTVLVIVQQVNDNRSGNQNKRFFTRQVQSNSEISEQTVVIIKEQNIVTISGSKGISNSPPSNTGASAAQSTGSAGSQSNKAPQLGTYDPNSSQFGGVNNNIDLIPNGVNQPQFNFGSQGVDPALIAQENQDIFVTFDQESEESIDNEVVTASSFESTSVEATDII